MAILLYPLRSFFFLLLQLFNACPCRLDNVDTYSNVLFVCEDSTELAYLAHHCVNLDRYRAETCCVVGNFFGLRGQHEKAVIYFRRALKLKTAYSLVWTLIGWLVVLIIIIIINSV